MYLLAFILAAILLPNLQRFRNLALTRDEWLSVLSAGIIGVIVGGRLGYVLFYEPEYFAEHPLQIFAVWQGGMASHGGFLGVGIALIVYSFWQRLKLLRVVDVITVPAAIGLSLGRIGNFINQELYGTVTKLPWGMQFDGAEGFRHPLQLYDAGLSLLLAFVCFLHLRSRPEKPGRTMALFLMLYSVMRFLLEYIRDQQYPVIDFWMMSLTRGQLLTVPFFLFGVLLWIWCGARKCEQH